LYALCGSEKSASGRSNSMAFSHHENQFAVSAVKLLTKTSISVALCLGLALCVQAQAAQSSSAGESTATTQIDVAHTTPLRTIENHTTSGNRTIDKQRVERLGLDGRYQPDSETETETVQESPTTTRTLVRTYRWDGNGQRKLAQVTEEEARSSSSGDSHVVRTTSNSDLNGNLQVAQREVADTKKTSPDEQETKTTTYTADGDGALSKSSQTQLQKRGADHRIDLKTTSLQPDGNGGWRVSEVTQKTITEDGKDRTTEESVLHPDLEGRLSEYSHTVGKETENAAGEKSSVVESYSTNVPGSARDGNIHLNDRATTIQKKNSDGEVTEERVEQPNPGNRSDGPQVSGKTKYIVHYAASGKQETKVIQGRDANGNFYPVSVETRSSDQPPPAQPQQGPSDKPNNAKVP
jgi:hypothetical protein